MSEKVEVVIPMANGDKFSKSYESDSKIKELQADFEAEKDAILKPNYRDEETNKELPLDPEMTIGEMAGKKHLKFTYVPKASKRNTETENANQYEENKPSTLPTKDNVTPGQYQQQVIPTPNNQTKQEPSSMPMATALPPEDYYPSLEENQLPPKPKTPLPQQNKPQYIQQNMQQYPQFDMPQMPIQQNFQNQSIDKVSNEYQIGVQSAPELGIDMQAIQGGLPIVDAPKIQEFPINIQNVPNEIPNNLPTNLPPVENINLPGCGCGMTSAYSMPNLPIPPVNLGMDVIKPTTPITLPTNIPTTIPTSLPTTIPETLPTTMPTSLPTTLPETLPTTIPTSLPPTLPETLPTTMPTTFPTTLPETFPTTIPTSLPTTLPPTLHETLPTAIPTCLPTTIPPTIAEPVDLNIPSTDYLDPIIPPPLDFNIQAPITTTTTSILPNVSTGFTMPLSATISTTIPTSPVDIPLTTGLPITTCTTIAPSIQTEMIDGLLPTPLSSGMVIPTIPTVPTDLTVGTSVVGTALATNDLATATFPETIRVSDLTQGLNSVLPPTDIALTSTAFSSIIPPIESTFQPNITLNTGFETILPGFGEASINPFTV